MLKNEILRIDDFSFWVVQEIMEWGDGNKKVEAKGKY